MDEYKTTEQTPEVKEKKGTFGKGFITGLLIATLLFGVIGGVLLNTTFHSANLVLDEAATAKMGLIYSMIKTYYYKDASAEDLSEGVLKGMVAGLKDPYSQYYTKEEYSEFLVDATGVYAGIGAVLSQNKTNGVVTIINVYDGSPAEEAGLLKGDIIISADEYKGAEMELSEFVSHVRGDEGTNVSLKILRGKETLDVEVTRRTITVPSVDHRILNDAKGDPVIGYVAITEFAQETAEEFSSAVEDLKKQGVTSMIYDVRDNPGGMVDSVVDINDYLLGEGTPVYLMDHNGKREDFTSDAATHLDMPAVVLINGNTASAAEIFSGALRDYDYATLVGTTTYGKGVVQNTYPLTDGSAVKLTVAAYYTPDGECIHEKGIAPDVELDYEYTGEGDTYDYYKDNQVAKAIEILSKGN